MAIEYCLGDALESDAEVLAHGVAAGNVEDMGTGIAKQIKIKWPETFSRFKKLRRNGFDLGGVILDAENTPKIAYLGTQENLYNAELSYVNGSLRKLRNLLEKKGVKTCAIPKIGCGYGKLQWDEVKKIMKDRLSESPVMFKVYEEYEAK